MRDQPAPPAAPAPTPAGTRARLIAAAAAEFADPGYDATNTNRIARRAGFAPQTFYRHFADKLAIFLEVHAAWVEADFAHAGAAATYPAMAAALVAHHRADLRFRRSLAQLARSETRVAAARAASRGRQLGELARHWPGFAALPRAGQLARLLQIERLSDAIAEGEFADLGIAEADALAELAGLLAGLDQLPK